nr:TerB family tellurite resistance protein [Rhodoblastus sphagnicola]
MRVASAALLVHVAEVDGIFSESERRALLLLLQQRFDVSEDQAQKLLAAGRQSDREAIDLYGFTSLLKDAMSPPERRRLVEMMWTIAYADGGTVEFEENVIWRVSELLGVPARDRIALRRKVRGDCGLDPHAPAPWDDLGKPEESRT